jgi:cyclopropane-fatty-acyl-phospholipid synthase
MKKDPLLGVSYHSRPIEPKTQFPPTALEKGLMRLMLQGMGDPDINVTFWDGESLKPRQPGPGMVLKDRMVLWRLLAHPTLHFGDDYSAGNIHVEGGLLPFLDRINDGLDRRPKLSAAFLKLAKAYRRLRGNPIHRARGNILHHYDISNDFYRLWLDDEMVYTCAYFAPGAETLEAAQMAKMEHVCRKLRLKPGDSVIEAGCGWGSLAMYMARQYGAKVRAFNLSHEQIAFARERAAKEGLDDRVEFIEDDYRNISGHHCYDAFVSVGMLEHVGEKHYRELGTLIDRTLTPQGRGLIHSIGQNQPIPTNAWIYRRIFPGGYTPTLRQMMDIFEPYNLSVLDVENLRLHYARTLEHWLQRFDDEAEQVRQRYDETFTRAWRLYLCGSLANFAGGHLQLYQLLFSRPRNNSLPMTRDDLYH